MARPTWRALVFEEPALETLRRTAAAYRRTETGPNVCANAMWYGYGRFRHIGLKAQLVQLVGCHREHRPEDPDWLYSSDAYDVAYVTVYRALPHCRRCLCC